MNNHQEPILDHRARAERARLEADQQRQRALTDQRDPANAPETRVRIWERLHQVRLPKSPEHAILATVARETGLALSTVLDVQRERAAPPAAPVTP
jgi:hypothetical protein